MNVVLIFTASEKVENVLLYKMEMVTVPLAMQLNRFTQFVAPILNAMQFVYAISISLHKLFAVAHAL